MLFLPRARLERETQVQPQGRAGSAAGRGCSLFSGNLRSAPHWSTGIYKKGGGSDGHTFYLFLFLAALVFGSFYRLLRWPWGPCADGDQNHHWARWSRMPLMVNTSAYPQCLPSLPLHLPTPWVLPCQERSTPEALRSSPAFVRLPILPPPLDSVLPTPPETQFLLYA